MMCDVRCCEGDIVCCEGASIARRRRAGRSRG